jgi:hypothetical protein
MSNIAEATTQTVVQFLKTEIDQRHLPVQLYEERALQFGRQIKIPAYVEGDYDAVDKARMLQSIEDAWNDRDPEPALIATLLPATQRQSFAE